MNTDFMMAGHFMRGKDGKWNESHFDFTPVTSEKGMNLLLFVFCVIARCVEKITGTQ